MHHCSCLTLTTTMLRVKFAILCVLGVIPLGVDLGSNSIPERGKTK
jgi:hypothetical protein